MQLVQTNIVYSDTKQSIYQEYSPGNLLGFIRYLISRDEFYRAFVELKRLDSYYPGYIKKENIFVTELFLLYKGRSYPDILLKEFNTADHNTKAIHEIFKTDIFFDKSEFVKASGALNSADFAGINKDIDFYLYKRAVLSYLLLNKIEEAKRITDDRSVSYDAGFDAVKFSELSNYTVSGYESFKKPYKAMLLGIIPGMGYAYAGEPATGIIAFLLVSLLSTLTYYSFKTDNKPAGIFIGAAATFFYGGSIIGGYLGAKRYNESAANDLKDSLSTKMRLADDRERIFNKYGVGGG